LNIIVCVKQVPETNEVKMDKKTNTLIREGVKSVINPFDTYALEEGLRLREKHGGKVVVLSMGIASAAEMLKDAIALGADDAVLMTDRAFAGADTLATAYALSTGISKIGEYDLIICGKQATDGDTAQVGPSLAEQLNIPHTTNVRNIAEAGKGFIRCQRMTEDGYEVVEMSLPALITVVKDINHPRLPSIRGRLRAKNTVIRTLSADDVGADRTRCGLSGSPTQVIRTFVPERGVEGEMLEGKPREQARLLVDRLLSMSVRTGA
jgi:electron transfer flavoprotein beta subunit